MTHIINEQKVNVAGKTPNSMGVRQGVDFTMSMIHHRQRPNEPLLLIGVVDSVGIETAIPMDAASVKRIANEMLEFAKQMFRDWMRYVRDTFKRQNQESKKAALVRSLPCACPSWL